MLGRIARALAVYQLGATARKVRAERLTYLSPLKMKNLERGLKSVLDKGIAGDVLEFGVALGGSAIVLAERARAAGRQFKGFDVFAMIPPPTSEKDDRYSKERYQTISSGKAVGIGGEKYYGYEEDLYGKVVQSFARHGLSPDGDEVVLVKGLFEDTWPSHKSERIAFAHVDCDWYDPVKYCLEQVAERLSVGGLIVLDDYNDYGGCRTATDEFLAKRPNYQFIAAPNPTLRRIV